MADDSLTESPLHTAAGCGHIEDVRKLLKSKQFNVNSLNSDKHTPLHLACINGHLDLVDVLVSEFNADIGALDKESNTPLLVAAHNGYIQIVFMLILISMYGRRTSNGDRLSVYLNHSVVGEGKRKLLEDLVYKYYNDHKAKEETAELLLTKFKDVIDNCGELNSYPLFLAAVFGLEDVTNSFIRDIANPNIKGFNNLTILHATCFGSNTELVENLISKHNLDPMAKDDDGDTPLHIAACCGHVRTVRLLATKYSADLFSKNHQDDTPLHVAATTGRMVVVHTLISEFSCDPKIKGFNGGMLLHQACQGNNTELVEILISKHNLHQMTRDNNGNTPLHIAAMCGHVEMVRLLATKYNADLFSKNHQKDTPLHVAATTGRMDVVHTLISEFSCDPKIKGFKGGMLLHQACQGNNTELVEILISKHNLDPLSKDVDGNTPLHIAAMCGHVETVRLLATKYNAALVSRNHQNSTPLQVATIEGRMDVVDTFINEFGCDPNIKGYKGGTLLHLACRGDITELVESLLSKHNLDPLSKDVDGNTPLHIAAMCGHVETVRLLATKYNAALVSRNHQNSTPLHVAATERRMKVVHTLISEFSCDPNIKGFEGRTLLHYVCHENNTELVESLISNHGLDPMAKDDDGNTPLHIAAMCGCIQTVRILATKYSAALFSRNHQNNTPLHVAATERRMNFRLVHTLISEFSCDPNIKGFKGGTLLHLVCNGKNTEMVETLISKHNLDPMAKDDDGNTPLHVAAECGHVETVRFLVSRYNAALVSRNHQNDTPLHLAATKGRMDVVDILIDKFNSYYPSIKGRTLLHVVCSGGNTELVENLISKHVLDPMDEDDDGNTLLHIAAMCGHIEMVRHLVSKYNVFLVSRNHRNDTPLHVAATEGRMDVVDTFIDEFGCDPNIKGYKGGTLLHQACRGDITELVESLLSKHNLDPLSKDDDGNTPLHIAAICGHIDTVRLLATRYIAALVSRNYQNNTPLHVAALEKRINVVDVLINEFSCNPNTKGSKGRTLLHLACEQGDYIVVESLISKYNISVFSTDEDGNTPLHIATIYGQCVCVNKLLYQFRAPLFVRNKTGKTASDIAKLSSQSGLLILDEFIEYKQQYGNTIQAEYDEMYQLAQKQYAEKKHLARLFVVGHPEAGKSTLIETIKTEGFFDSLKYFFSGTSSSVPPHTAGIVPSVHDSDQYGRVLFYDFAGDPEYYSSHAAILESLNSSEGVDIFFVVCDLSADDSLISSRYGYWLSFITHNLQRSSATVMPIGSHADILKSLRTTESHKLDVVDRISQRFSNKELKVETGIALDCRKPRKVVDQLKSRVRDVSHRAPPVELSLEARTLFGLLLKDFANVTACKCEQLISHIEETGLPLPINANQLYSVVKQLHNLGLLLIIEKEGDPIENHLLALNMSTLTSEVHKMLFSKCASDQLALLTNSLQLSVGIIPETLLDKILPEYITKECLLQLQYCQEIESVFVEEDCTLTQSQVHSCPVDPAPTKSLLFFPALCQLKREDVSWATAPSSGYALGWYAKCEKEFDYFPTRFLHVLTIRLALTFALRQHLPSSNESLISKAGSTRSDLHKFNRRCHVWTTGLHWLMENGVEVFVDMIKEAENRELVVIARSADDCTIECATTFQKVIQTVIEAKVEFCHSITPSVYLLDPDKLKDQVLPDMKNVPLYTLKDVEVAIAEGKKRAVSVDGRHCSPPQRLTSLAQCSMSYWKLFFPMDMDIVLNCLKEVVSKWKLLGMNLSVPQETLETIDHDYPKVQEKKTALIQTWMTSTCKPTWCSLVEALRSPSIAFHVKADEISREHSVPLQEKILDPNNSLVHPDHDFLESFATIVGPRWQCLASLLSLTSQDIESIKRDTHGAGPPKQAFLMLEKWTASETATYGLLCERLRTLSVFHI